MADSTDGREVGIAIRCSEPSPQHVQGSDEEHYWPRRPTPTEEFLEYGERGPQ